MERIEYNLQTGEYKRIPLTPEEIADAQARTAAEQAQRLEKKKAAEAEARRQKAIEAMLEKMAADADAPVEVAEYVESKVNASLAEERGVLTNGEQDAR